MINTITPEAIIALVLGLIQNVIILVGLNLTQEQKGAISGVVTSVIVAAFLGYSAWVQHSHAKVKAAAITAGRPLV